MDGAESIILSKEVRQSMTNWKDFLVKKVAVVSHDYNLINRYGHQDFAEHFSQINKLCDNQDTQMKNGVSEISAMKCLL